MKTDIKIALSSGCYGRIAPPSSLATKHFIDEGVGILEETLVLWCLILAKKV